MKILETSDVGIDDSRIFRGEKRSPHSCQQMMASPKFGTNDLYSPDFTKKVRNLSHSPELYDLITREEFKDELVRFSETIDLHAKSLLSDSGIDSFLAPDSSEDDVSLDGTCIGTLLEDGQDRHDEVDSEDDVSLDGTRIGTLLEDGQDRHDEVDAEDVESQTFMTTMPPYNFSVAAEDLSEDSCEMSSIELDLSSQNNEISDDEMFLELMKGLNIDSSKISDSCKFDPSCYQDQFFDKNNVDDFEREETTKNVSCFQNVVDDGDNSLNFMQNDSAKSVNPEKSDFFVSFLPNKESSLCSLPERAYVKIAESLLDEQTMLTLNAEENCLSNCSSDYAITMDTPNIMRIASEMTSSDDDLKASLSTDEIDPFDKTCPMTYVDLDVNGPSKETLMMLERLSIKDDMIFVRRGNPSEQDEIQNPSSCSRADKSDCEDADGSPLTYGMTDTQMDLNAFANATGGVSMQNFCSSKTFLPSNVEFNFASSDCGAQTFNTVLEASSIEEQVSSEINSLESSLFSSKDSSINFGSNFSNVSFLDPGPENEIPFEHAFVTQNLHKLIEVNEFLGLSKPELPKCDAIQDSFATESHRSLNSNVIPRVMTQTPGTQSKAIPTISGIVLVFPTSSIHGVKRPPHDALNNSWFSEADSRKKAKQSVADLTDKQLAEFVNKESCLHEAVRSQNSEYVLALLKRLASNSDLRDIINSKNGKKQTALHLAVQAKIPAIVYLLIKHGAEVNEFAISPSNKFETPLHYVASQGNKFRLVLNCLFAATGLDINIKNSEGQTALLCAAEAHKTGGSNSTDSIDCEYIIKKLLNCGADPLLQDNRGKNLLMYVIESKDVNLLSHIIKSVGKDDVQELLAAKTTNGQTCLSLAYSLKEQFNQVQWEKINTMLTQHASNG